LKKIFAIVKFGTKYVLSLSQHTTNTSMKKLVLASLSLFIMGAAQAQDRTNQEYKDGMDDAADVSAVLHNTGCITGRNVISLAPFQFTENGWGFGASYERTLGHQDYVSFYLPVMFTAGSRHNEYHGYYGGGYDNGRNRMFYAMPGIKFYPTHMGKVKYALGPSLVAGFGRRSEPMYYGPYYSGTYPGYYYNYEVDRALLGVMVNNSINFNPTPHLHISAEFGLGYSYLDRVNGYNRYNTFLTQGNFKIGYRF
jgi:hypothetical protein